MNILNQTKNTVIASECKIADSFFTRFMGLMGEKSLSEGSGLLIVPCNSIHMFFMKIPLDVIFIDKNNNVVHVIENILPWRVSKLVRNAHATIELPVGTIVKSRTEAGDNLVLNPYQAE